MLLLLRACCLPAIYIRLYPTGLRARARAGAFARQHVRCVWIAGCAVYACVPRRYAARWWSLWRRFVLRARARAFALGMAAWRGIVRVRGDVACACMAA